MGMTYLHRLIPLACLLALALFMLGCGGTAGRTSTPATIGGGDDTAATPAATSPPQAADVAVPDAAEIAALPAPDGVDSGVWATLTAELNRVLADYRGCSPAAGGIPVAGFSSSQPTKVASAPPTGDAGVVELSYYEPTSTLRWLYVSLGDYDQNGIVGVSDLTPLGVHFGEESPDGAGQPFPPESLGAAIDGNGDGLIGVGDITSIGQYFGAQVAGYHVYFSDDPNDYPLDPADDNGSGTVLSDQLDFSAALGETSERKHFEYALAEDAAPGVYWVRPTDGSSDGAASNAVSVGVANLAPIAVLGATPSMGLAPLTVQFNALGSGDLDGTIAKYEWDWDGALDGEEWEDTGMLGVVTHVYSEPGSYLPVVRVTDDGGATATDELLIKAKTPSPPVASLLADAPDGPAPLAVQFDAGASGDFDGFITSYEWDFDGSGGYACDTGLESTATFYYYEPGTYSTSVRVTDDDGLTGTVSVEVTVENGAEWHDVYVPGMDRPYNCTALLEVAGKPAIAYDTRTNDPAQYWQKYVRADDAEGTVWPEPLTIHELGIAPNDTAIEFVNGRPAIASCVSSGLIKFSRADDSDGTTWPTEPTGYYSYSGYSTIAMAVVGGLPALSAGKYFTPALDLEGLAWADQIVYASGSFDQDDAAPALCIVSGQPAISYYGDGRLLYVRADNAEGQSWGVSTPVDDQDSAKGGSRLLVVDGQPAIAYHDATLGALKYARALDAVGSAWAAGRVLAPRGVPYGLILLDDRPAILYRDTADKTLNCLIANDPVGANWGFPTMVSTAETKDTSPSLALVGGGPAASFLEDGEIHWLHYAAYY